MKAIYLFGTAFVGLALAQPISARKAPELSGLELQQIQSKDFDVGKDMTFPAVMSVLQDAGYRIQAADRDTGLITGIASTSGHATWIPFVGLGRSKLTPVVSAYIEDRGRALSRIRLNFVMTSARSNQFGASNDEKPVTDPIPYKEAFEKIEKAVFVRQAMGAPSAGAEPAAAVLSPSATPSQAAAGIVTTAAETTLPK